MSLQAILEAIRLEGDAQILEIECQASSQAGEILATARVQADTIAEQAFDETTAPAARELARITHRARLEALRQLGDVRESIIDSALDQTRGRLKGLRGESIYPLVFRHLVEEALSALNMSADGLLNIFLRADQRDQMILETLLDELEWETPVNYDLKCWGGVIAKSEDNRVVVINTLEARLKKATPYLRGYLAALFEEEFILEAEHSSQEILVH